MPGHPGHEGATPLAKRADSKDPVIRALYTPTCNLKQHARTACLQLTLGAQASTLLQWPHNWIMEPRQTHRVSTHMSPEACEIMFQVRGANYLKDKKKVEAEGLEAELLNVDLVEVEEKFWNIAEVLPAVTNSTAPFMFIMQARCTCAAHAKWFGILMTMRGRQWHGHSGTPVLIRCPVCYAASAATERCYMLRAVEDLAVVTPLTGHPRHAPGDGAPEAAAVADGDVGATAPPEGPGARRTRPSGGASRTSSTATMRSAPTSSSSYPGAAALMLTQLLGLLSDCSGILQRHGDIAETWS